MPLVNRHLYSELRNSHPTPPMTKKRRWIRTFALTSLGAIALGIAVRYTADQPDTLLRRGTQTFDSVGKMDRGCDPLCPSLVSIRDEAPFSLGVVELNDDGDLRDPQQLAAFLSHVDEVAQSSSVLWVVFVHGWNNDARQGNSDLACFAETLSAVSELQAYQDISRSTVGLFVSWRGAKFKRRSPLRFLSFWDRRRAADVIAVGEGLRQIGESLYDRRPSGSRPLPTGSRTILVGHSFGARILWSGLGGSSERPRLRDLGDAAVFLNPAFDAALIDSHLTAENRFLPPSMVLASEGDVAVGFFYPAAGAVESLMRLKNPAGPPGAGHSPSNLTDVVTLSGVDSVPGTSLRGPGCPYARAEDLSVIQHLRSRDSTDRGLTDLRNYRNFNAPRLGNATVRLAPIDGNTPQPSVAPFHAALVSDTIIPDHNHFWTPEVLDLITRFVNSTALSRAEAP